MYSVDGYKDQLCRCLFPAGEVVNVKITCRCQTMFTASMPRALIDAGAVPVLACPNQACNKEFVYYQGQISRISDFKTVNGVQIPSNLQDYKTWTKEF